MSKCIVANISKEMMDSLNINYSYVTQEELNIEMKDLLLKNNQCVSSLLFSESIIYMDGYDENQMNAISAFFKQHAIYPIYVASTSTNLNWSFHTLYKEVLEEHQTFESMNELKRLIQLHMNKTEVSKETLMNAFIILQSGNVEEIKKQIEILKG